MRAIPILVVIAVVGGGLWWLARRMSHEVVSPVQVLNPDGEKGTALIVYHPGMSSFPRRVTYAFAEGLASAGWRAEITTASSEAPADTSGYDLIVLSGPAYGGSVAQPVRDYLRRLGDLGGKRSVLIVAGAGSTDKAVSEMEQLLLAANGTLVRSLPVWTMKPNEELYEMSDAEEIMRHAGGEIGQGGE